MNKKIVRILICLLFIGTVIPQTVFFESVKADPGDVINIFDTPGYYCWGVAWNWKANTIWASGVAEGTMHIFEVDPSDGKILQDLNINQPGGVDGSFEIFTYDGNYFWAKDPYGSVIFKIDSSDGSIIDSFNFLDGVDLLGLSWDWNSNILYALGLTEYGSQRNYSIYKVNNNIWSIEKYFDIKLENGVYLLSFDGANFWSYGYGTFDIGFINYDKNSNVLEFYYWPFCNCPPLKQPIGMTFGGNYIWFTYHVYESQVILEDPICQMEISVVNHPPDTPSIIGEANGKTGEEYEYCLDYAYDPDGDALFVWWDWGDGTDTSWLGPYDSDEPMCATHSWSEEGTYTIKAKLKDPYDTESDWATLEVSMPKSKAIKPLFLQKLFQSFSFFEKILKQILKT
jgi:hypothetical protein